MADRHTNNIKNLIFFHHREIKDSKRGISHCEKLFFNSVKNIIFFERNVFPYKKPFVECKGSMDVEGSS